MICTKISSDPERLTTIHIPALQPIHSCIARLVSIAHFLRAHLLWFEVPRAGHVELEPCVLVLGRNFVRVLLVV